MKEELERSRRCQRSKLMWNGSRAKAMVCGVLVCAFLLPVFAAERMGAVEKMGAAERMRAVEKMGAIEGRRRRGEKAPQSQSNVSSDSSLAPQSQSNVSSDSSLTIEYGSTTTESKSEMHEPKEEVVVQYGNKDSNDTAQSNSFDGDLSPKNTTPQSTQYHAAQHPKRIVCDSPYSGALGLTFSYQMHILPTYQQMDVIPSLELALLDALSHQFLPCDRHHDRRTLTTHNPPSPPNNTANQTLNIKDIGIVGLVTGPWDDSSVRDSCQSQNKRHSCLIVDATITMFLSAHADLQLVRYYSRAAIMESMTHDYLPLRVQGLVSVTYNGPSFSHPTYPGQGHSPPQNQSHASKHSALRNFETTEIIMISAVLSAFFAMMGVLFIAHMLRFDTKTQFRGGHSTTIKSHFQNNPMDHHSSVHFVDATAQAQQTASQPKLSKTISLSPISQSTFHSEGQSSPTISSPSHSSDEEGDWQTPCYGSNLSIILEVSDERSSTCGNSIQVSSIDEWADDDLSTVDSRNFPKLPSRILLNETFILGAQRRDISPRT